MSDGLMANGWAPTLYLADGRAGLRGAARRPGVGKLSGRS